MPGIAHTCGKEEAHSSTPRTSTRAFHMETHRILLLRILCFANRSIFEPTAPNGIIARHSDNPHPQPQASLSGINFYFLIDKPEAVVSSGCASVENRVNRAQSAG